MDLAGEALRLAEIAWHWRNDGRLDKWQRRELSEIMATDQAGSWTSRVCALAVSRQQGKNDILQAREVYGGITLGERMLHTAQNLRTSKDAFRRVLEVAEKSPVGDYVQGRPRHRDGEEAINWVGGGVLEYGTRTGGGGRGLSGMSLVVYDESQHVRREHIAASAPTTIAAEHSQTIYTGSGGLDHSEVWWEFREQGLRLADSQQDVPGTPMTGRICGRSSGLLWIEYTAETITVHDGGEIEYVAPDPLDRSVWPLANPALAEGRISEDAIAALIVPLGDKFPAECVGVWEPLKTKGPRRAVSKVPADAWARQVDPTSKIRNGLVFAVATDWEMTRAAVVACGRRDDGRRHVELIEAKDGTEWLGSFVAALCASQRPALLVDAGGPTRQVRPVIDAVAAEHRVERRSLGATDYAAACGAFAADVAGGDLVHLGDAELSSSVLGCQVQGYGREGAWIWSWRSEVDPTPVVAATTAAWAAATVEAPRSAYEDGQGLTVV